MPAPATADEFFDLIRKSGLVDDARLTAYQSRGDRPAPRALAGELVRDGVLTGFQAEQLMQGKWKRFHIGKYRILEKLGTGGMGQVFLCEHKLMRRRVAVKVLPAAKAADPASLERFYREARAVAALDHPNIVRAYDIDQDESLHFLVMEYVDGISLQELVMRFGPLDPVRACHYVNGIAVGLHHASQAGLVHRDIKPANILVERTGVVKVLDMGLARFFNPDENDLLTKKYDENVLGTADYLAPEQAVDSHAVDIRADLYALGGTFYFLLTGRSPFPDGTVAQKLLSHQSREPVPIQKLRPEVPDEIVAVVRRLMAKEPADRYQTPAELLAVLADRVRVPIPPPADAEMPQLSPAALGVGRPAPVTTNAMSQGTAPSAALPPASPRVSPAAAPVAVQDPMVQRWCQAAAETATRAKADTDTGRPVPFPPAKRRRSRLPLAAGLLAAGLIGGSLAIAFWPKGTPPTSTAKE